jgi:UDP-glucuronate decarboxylase
MTVFFEKNTQVVNSITSSDCIYIIIGASGWIGRATVEYLSEVLGSNSGERIKLFGSSARKYKTNNGITLEINDLKSNGFTTQKPCLVFHYAFLTMDKVKDMTLEDYVANNIAIRNSVLSLLNKIPFIGLTVPSSGAIYDFLHNSKSRTAAANIYGRLKYEDEYFFEGVSATRNTSFFCPRVFNISGPFINKPEVYALSSFILKAIANTNIEILSAHPVIRAYSPIQTLIELQLLCSGKEGSCERFDFASDEKIEIGDLAQIIAKKFNVSIIRNVNYSSEAQSDTYLGEVTRLKQLMGLYKMPTINLDRQISNTADYLTKSLSG